MTSKKKIYHFGVASPEVVRGLILEAVTVEKVMDFHGIPIYKAPMIPEGEAWFFDERGRFKGKITGLDHRSREQRHNDHVPDLAAFPLSRLEPTDGDGGSDVLEGEQEHDSGDSR